jgi:hypothetical protein
MANPTVLSSETAAYLVRDTSRTPSASSNSDAFAARPLNAWAVIGDWIADGGASVSERCNYRDYPRLVLTRRGPRGLERLFIDEKSGFPVKLERDEPSYLWGQNRVEYVYSTWQRLGPAAAPGVSFRLVDGVPNVERNISSMRLVQSDSAPNLDVPHAAEAMGYALPAFLEPTAPDTVRVGANAFLLRNRGYAELVALDRDTVFVFDATQGDERARRDSAWIGALFPGRHPIALVVTDLAWPHIAGVRYWASLGVPIYTHRAARAFLDSVIARRWVLTRDALERKRPHGRPRIQTLSDTLRLAGGDILLFAIDGVSSEVALAAYLGSDRLVWASDYVQDAREPTMYLDEVCRAIVRVGRQPDVVVAEHLPPTRWSALRPLAHCGRGEN